MLVEIVRNNLIVDVIMLSKYSTVHILKMRLSVGYCYDVCVYVCLYTVEFSCVAR